MLLFALLSLGAFVTSFRVGMADPIWPTRPWQLALIDWQEQSRGFLIEHTHRLFGFLVGTMTAILSLGLWATERKAGLRWTGLAALVALLGAYGQLHGSLIQQQKLFRESQSQVLAAGLDAVVPQPNWFAVAAPTGAAFVAVAAVLMAAIRFGSAGRHVRVLGAAMLIGVMVQGLLGGLRVYLDALFGTQLAAIHGVFAQLVVATAVVIFVCLRPRQQVPADDRMHHEAAAAKWALATAILVFAQIVAGAILRHTTSPLGPRLHLLIAFAVFAGVIITGRLMADAPPHLRRLKVLQHALVGLQILIGIEAWLHKFASGIVAAEFQPVTVGDAVIRTAHSVIGYGLFAASVALAVHLCRPMNANGGPRRFDVPAELETVA